MNPLCIPDPSRVSVDATNATIQDIAQALVAPMTRAQEYDNSHDKNELMAFIGNLQKLRRIIDKVESHAVSDLKKLGGTLPTGKRRRDPLSLPLLQLRHSSMTDGQTLP